MGCLWCIILLLVPIFGAFGFVNFQSGNWLGAGFYLVIVIVLLISLAELEYGMDDERVGQ